MNRFEASKTAMERILKSEFCDDFMDGIDSVISDAHLLARLMRDGYLQFVDIDNEVVVSLICQHCDNPYHSHEELAKKEAK